MSSVRPSASGPAGLAPDQRLWQLPNRTLLWVYLCELIRVSALWLLVYGGCSWVTSLHSYRLRLWTDLDLAIPFVPAAAAVYLSLFPLLWLSPLLLQTQQRLQSFARSLCWLIVLSGVGFLLFPSDDAYSQQTPTGIFGALFRFADHLNLSYNYLPSLHVGMATVCAWFYSRHMPPKVAAVFWLWGAAIACSALCTHQHYLADVLTGAALGVAVAAWCLRSPIIPAGWQA